MNMNNFAPVQSKKVQIRLAINGNAHNNNEKLNVFVVIVRLSLRSCLCSAKKKPYLSIEFGILLVIPRVCRRLVCSR